MSKLRLGIVAVGYQCLRLCETLAPFVTLKCGVYDQDKGQYILEPHPELDIKIAVCAGLFKERWDAGEVYDNELNGNLLKAYEESGAIDKFIEVKEPILDFESRNYCWNYLQQFKPEVVMQSDIYDEFYTTLEIVKIINFVKNNPLVDTFHVRFRNYFGVDKPKKYVLDFCPPRINWNNRRGGIKRFYWDNFLEYESGQQSQVLSKMDIPVSVARPTHLSWVGSLEFLQKKRNYQIKALGHCSYCFKDGEIIIDEEYYKKLGIPLPEIHEA
ncbi:MAG: hypothetical protein AABY22_06180 [Nanoarchaeota archaeon]